MPLKAYTSGHSLSLTSLKHPDFVFFFYVTAYCRLYFIVRSVNAFTELAADSDISYVYYNKVRGSLRRVFSQCCLHCVAITLSQDHGKAITRN